MKILVTGASGLLGKKLIDILEKNDYKTYGTYNKTKKDNFYQLDVTDKEEVNSSIKKLKPDIIIHSAAYTDVDGCEKNKKLAFKVNVEGTKNIANACTNNNCKMVYISTDYVFDGKKGFYKEKDSTNPIGYYGLTKLKGEGVVTDICNDYLICRTSVLYGLGKNNFVKWLINSLKDNKEVNIVVDQYVNPTYNLDLSEQILALIKNNKKGIFHTAGADRINRYDFSKILAKVFDFDEDLIKSCEMKDMNWIAPRAKDTSFDVSKISNIKKPMNVKNSLLMFKKEYDEVEK